MKAGKVKKFNFIVTVEDDKISSVNKIASELKKEEGVIVNQVLTLSGIITGQANNANQLNKFKYMGLKSVEEDTKKQAW